MKFFASILFLNLFFSVGLIAQQEEVGIASYYSDKFHGKPTASGELYNKNDMTGAHKTLPFGSIVKVTRMDNGKSVRVKITDRGPFISGRIVEISRAAAEKIGLVKAGVAEVRLDIVKELAEPSVTTAPAIAPKSEPTEKEIAKVAAESPKKEVTKPTNTEKKAIEKVTATEKAAPKAAPVIKETSKKPVIASKSTAADRMTLVKGAEYQPYGLYSVQLKKPAREGYGVQVASLGTIDGAFRKIAELQGQWFENILMNMEKGKDGEKVYKIILGPFDDQASATAYNKSLKKKKMKGFVVSLAPTDTAAPKK
jgi:rare lipoprotein A